MRKLLVYLMFGVMLLTANKIAIAKEETRDKIFHFVFKTEKTISDTENDAIFDILQHSMDSLGIGRVSIIKDRDLFIVTTKTTMKPEDIIAQMQPDKFSVPITLLTYFVCDVFKNKKHFFGDDSSPVPK